MNREQATWLGGGLAFGFVAGFVLAYAMTVDTTVGNAGSPAPTAASSAPAAAGGAAADPHGDVRGMLEALNQRLEQNPEDTETLLQLAEIYLQAGMADQALGYLDRLEALEPGAFRSQLMRAMALEGLGREEEFAALVDLMAQQHPDRWEAQYLLAAHHINHHHDSGDLEKARAALARVEELNPGLPEAAGLRTQLEQIEAAHVGEAEASTPG